MRRPRVVAAKKVTANVSRERRYSHWMDLKGTPQDPYLRPNHFLDLALRYVGRWPILPVVSRANLGKLEGQISIADVLSKYWM